MNLRDLQYLVAVADHRHFGEAAEACMVSQPTLSTQIKKLETELGVPLIERHPRNIVLTRAGESIVAQAREVFKRVDDIEAIARSASNPAAGTLRLGVFPTLAPYLLPHIVPGLRASFPELEMLLTEEKTEVLHNQLRDARLDAVILARPVADDQLTEDRLFSESFVLAVPSSHHLAQREAGSGPTRRVDVSVLTGENVLLLDEGHCLRDQALDICGQAKANERAGFRATSLETLRQMVIAGVGITLLPQLSVLPPLPQSPDLKVVDFAQPAPGREIAMYWRRSSPHHEFLSQFAARIRALVKATGLPGVSVADGQRHQSAPAGAYQEPLP